MTVVTRSLGNGPVLDAVKGAYLRQSEVSLDTLALTVYSVFQVVKTGTSWQAQVYSGGTWVDVGDAIMADRIEIRGLVFNLEDSSTALSSFVDLSAGGDIYFGYFREIYDGATSTSRLVSPPHKYSDASIESTPFTNTDSGNIIFDTLHTHSSIIVKIVTSEALTGLEIPVECYIIGREEF
ncbi:MAG: hypothetical protein UY48_C0044G0003 [Candidatus Gottesmanbacteria bacterium GW2011_GWB1_49_7]|uniref:Uncharacterized protein n=1 Tax=Candidatus Gottesmanbacteria bacterium GW2011_GWB1_49_7 TaxID=1618448 RepID=A0A0G1YV41_9BACT|nr:MAG: hypothetical protein UY48_C0044G0003 [Candidatus Gottesmanbacteria bacterium GW2011_GWB1_49_7]